MRNNCLALATITFWEGIRNRSVYGVVLFSLLIFGFNIAVADFFMRDVGKVTVDINLAALMLAGLLLVFFVGLNLMAKDIDRKTIQVVLSKPISRGEYVFGKFLGIQMLMAVSLMVLFGMSCGTISFLKIIYKNYFFDFIWINYFLASIFILVKLGVVSAITVFFSSVTTNSFIALIFSISIYIVGESIEDVVFYLKTASAVKELAISPFLSRLMDVLSYVVPNFSVFDYKTEASHGLVIGFERAISSLGYGFIYITIFLFLTSMVFQRREFN